MREPYCTVFWKRCAGCPTWGIPTRTSAGRSQLSRRIFQRPEVRDASRSRALRYIDAVRAADTALLSAQNLLNSFPLATPEGIALLRLAEALLRAPDAETQTWLIAEKLAHFRDTRIGMDGNFVTRVLATALKIAGHTAADAELQDAGADRGSLRAWLAKSALRPLVIDGIRRFGDQFVFATNLPDAMARVRRRPDSRVTYSFDMLGEGARTRADADRSYTSYVDALESLKGALKQEGGRDWTARDGISVKLSAIHPRFETAQIERCERELYPRLVELAELARSANVNLTVDAEESERLVLHIAIFERLMREPTLGDWPGLGIAIQSYQPRALRAVNHLLQASEELRRPIAMRLVKGAYWDAEIKRAQELGMSGLSGLHAQVGNRHFVPDRSAPIVKPSGAGISAICDTQCIDGCIDP